MANSLRKILPFSFFVLGFSSIISQTLVIRELLITFYGNELFSSLSLAFWLVLVGIGSFFLGRRLSKFSNLKAVVFLHFLIAIILMGEFFLLRLGRRLIVSPGVLPNTLPSLILTFFILSPLCLIFGLIWTLASRFYLESTGNSSERLNFAYLFESVGSVVGGIFFSFLLVRLFTVSVVVVLGIVNLGIGALFLILFGFYNKEFRWLKIVFYFLVLSLIIFSFNSSYFERLTQSWRFPQQEILEIKNTKYSNLTLTKAGESFLFFQNGLLLELENRPFNEEFIHLSLLSHPHPENVLFIGPGGGMVSEVFKHPVRNLTYLQIDPELINFEKRYLSLSSEFQDPRLSLETKDARYFLNHTNNSFDIIFLNLGEPSTLLWNRFYTKEFFRDIKNHLSKDGIFSIYFSSPKNYLSREAENFSRSIYQALKENFSYISIVPATYNIYLCSQTPLASLEEILGRFEKRGIKTKFITPASLSYYTTNDRAKILKKRLDEKTQTANSDFFPQAYLYWLIFWLKGFYPQGAKLLNFLAKVRPWQILIFAFLFLLIFRIYKKKEKFLPFLTWIPDFTLLSLEVIFIFCFQVFYGLLYQYLAMLLALIMLGIASGTLSGHYLSKKPEKTISFLFSSIYLALVAFLIITLFVLKTRNPFWLAMPVLFGFLAGAEFPLVNRLYLSSHPSRQTGIIYSADIWGSALGASLASLFFVPFWGIFATLKFFILLNLIAFLFSRTRRTTQPC